MRAIRHLSPFIVLVAVIIMLPACDPQTETLIQGNRSVEQVTVGKLRNGDGNYRLFYVLRDPATGADYLAVVAAGIIKLDPLPKGVEK